MPHTIAENLARLAAARTAIAGAITAKGGTVAADDGLEDFPTDIATIPSGGGGGGSAKDVIFYDYDGAIVQSYTKNEFLALDAMPENPSHQGLTAQGWNWSLADAKAYVTAYRRLNIGQTYITSDGKTRIKIKLEAGRLSPVLGLGINGSVDVDWGDGTAHGTMTGNDVSTLVQLQHVYAAAGEYTIALTITGSVAFLGDATYKTAILRKTGVTSMTVNESQVYQNAVQELYIGNGVTSIKDYAFYSCYSLMSITIPNNMITIDAYAFYSCYLLTSVTIPSSVTSVGSNTFNDCISLASITIPNSIATISNNMFSSCYSLASITIPNSVTSVGGSAFAYCYSLVSITIPNSMTSVSSSVFSSCYSLASITIPDGVTSIGLGAFSSCSSLAFIKFEGNTPPKVSASNAFTSVPTDCIIYVPTGTRSSYTTATNYPDPNTYTYIEY